MQTSTKAESLKLHFFWVDILRAVAAIAVLLWHYQHFFIPRAIEAAVFTERSIMPFYKFFFYFYEFGFLAVNFFWVLSGFVFASTYLKREKSSVIGFFIKRVARLYPLHLLTLLVVSILQVTNFRLLGYFQIYPVNDWYHFFLQLLLASNWGWETSNSFNGPIWSVSVEVLIYALFFTMLPFFFRYRALGVISTLFAFMILIFSRASIPQIILECGVFFFLGTLTFLFVEKNLNRKTFILLTAASGILVFAALFWFNESSLAWLWWLSVFFPALLLFFVYLDLSDTKKIGQKGQIVGNLSYGIYLWHFPIQLLILLLLDTFSLGRILATTNIFWLSYISLVIAVSFVSYVSFEKPAKQWIRRYARDQ